MGLNSGSWPDKPLSFHRGHFVQMVQTILILWPLQLIKPGGENYYMLPNNIQYLNWLVAVYSVSGQ